MKSIPIEKAIEIALEQHRAGHFRRAEEMYLSILQQDPHNVDAIHLLGVLATQGKRPDVAVELIGRAISRKPDAPIFHYNLGEALSALKRYDEALASYRKAIELEPAYFDAHNNIGNVLNERGQFIEAEKHCRLAIELDGESAAPWNNLGNALRGQARYADAEASYRKAIELSPQFAQAMANLAVCLCQVKRHAEAIDIFRDAIRLNPAHADLHNNMGVALSLLNRFSEAAACYQTAIDIKPDHAGAHENLGSALRAVGRVEDAIRYFEKSIELDPSRPSAHGALAAALSSAGRRKEAEEVIDKAGALRPTSANDRHAWALVLRDLHRPDEAVEAVRSALEVEPDNAGALASLGYALLERGDLEEAMFALRRAAELKPDPHLHSNVLLTVNYHPGYSPTDLLETHRGWAEVHEKPHVHKWPKHKNDRDPDRRLRVGYVSPDFRAHAVSFFLEPILDHHDHEKFEIFGYAQVPNPDGRTWSMRAELQHWRDTLGVPPDDVAKMIEDDQIDILVELAGHTAGNAMPIFARKPAPVQINMIGFPSTTGLRSMDYRVTDNLCDPPGETEKYNVEKLIRLPGLFWVYRPPRSPDVGALPADENDGVVTFTSVNNFTKVTPYVQQLWAKVLAAVPKSRLVLQTNALSSQHTQRLVRERFAAEGVSADRLEFRKWSDMESYLKLLDRSDMTLDPFPFNGGTTTCHSLWMGAPVITLAGDRHASRMGLSMMTAVGLPEFIAYSHEQYVRIAVEMASNLSHLRKVRAGMRQRLENSPLRDEVGYTRNLEAAFRHVWREWCANGT